MKRILTLAIAAMLVVAFAIPTLAAPKVELVGGAVKTIVGFDSTLGWWGTQLAPQFGALKLKFSADNFVFDATTAFNVPRINKPTETLSVPTLQIVDYSFSLALPYVDLTGYYKEYQATGWAFHMGRELRIASNEQFKEMAGFGWNVYANDDLYAGTFQSLHANIEVPVGEAFTGTLTYIHQDVDIHTGAINGRYTIDDNTYVNVTAMKNITSATDDFLFDAMFGFPVVEGWTGTASVLYGMKGFAVDPDTMASASFDNLWAADTFEFASDFRYNNEAANAEVLALFYSNADFSVGKTVALYTEYVSNGSLSYDASDRPSYGANRDSKRRGWDTVFGWVRNNKDGNFAVGASGDYYIEDKNWDATIKGMYAFAPVPVVVTAKAYLDYNSTLADALYYQVDNWIGVRLNSDIHFALHNAYDNNVKKYNLDAQLAYAKDSVTATLGGYGLTTTNPFAELYLGFSF